MMESASTISVPAIRSTVDRLRATAIRSVVLIAALLATTLLVVWSGVPASAAVAPLTINQCNGLTASNVGGQAVACDVTVTNDLNLASGLSSSVVTVRVCHGAANAPPTCTITTTRSRALVSTVTQCNGSGNGGGATVTCAVHVVNTITGVAPAKPATINQCNGSGTGGGTAPTVVCSPIGSTTKATLTQCNSSGNGGGGTKRVQCTITTSTQTAALPVTVNQCVGSGNGGGATVTCTASLINNVVPAAASRAVALTPGAPAGPAGPGGPPTSLARTGAPVGMLSLASLTAIMAGGAVLLLARPRRRPRRH